MANPVPESFRRFSWPIALSMAALIAIGVTAIRTAERADASPAGYASSQTVFAAVGLAAFAVATAVHYRRLGPVSYGLFVLTLGLLVVVLLLPESRGSKRWITLGGPVRFQPSELTKLTFIIALAWYLRYRHSYRRLAGLIVPFAITLVPLGLILAEPDLGTALLLLPTLMVMLLAAGARWRHLLVILGLGLAVVLLPVPRPVDAQAFDRQAQRFDAWRLGPIVRYSPKDIRRPDGRIDWSRRPATPVAYARLQIGDGTVFDLQPLSLAAMTWAGRDYQVRRVEGWLRMEDPRVRADTGYQQYHSMLILGAGGIAGQRRLRAGDEHFQMLPDDHTDFIFSIIGARWGFAGCAGVMVLYGIIFLFGAEAASATTDAFGRLLAVGVLALMAAQLFINVGMTMGLMPVTGMTLPLVSYGGSSLVVNCMALGLLVNVGRHRPITLAPRPFEFAQDDI